MYKTTQEIIEVTSKQKVTSPPFNTFSFEKYTKWPSLNKRSCVNTSQTEKQLAYVTKHNLRKFTVIYALCEWDLL